MPWEVKNMSLFDCNCKCRCAAAAVIAGIIVGILAAFLQITGTITVTAVFLWVTFGIAVVYLAVLEVAAALARRGEACACRCTALNVVLAGILGTILLAVVLLAVGIVATSVVSAILVGLLLLFLTLVFAGTACIVRSLTDCET